MGVHVNLPVCGSMVASCGAPGARLKVSGVLMLVTVGVMTSVSPWLTDWSAMGPNNGGPATPTASVFCDVLPAASVTTTVTC